MFRIGKRIFMLKEDRIGKDGHIKKLIFEEVNKKEYKNKIKSITKEILKTKDIDRETILEEALLQLSTKKLEEVKRKLKNFKKPRFKKGCLNIEIDGIEIPIFSRGDCLS